MLNTTYDSPGSVIVHILGGFLLMIAFSILTISILNDTYGTENVFPIEMWHINLLYICGLIINGALLFIYIKSTPEHIDINPASVATAGIYSIIGYGGFNLALPIMLLLVGICRVLGDTLGYIGSRIGSFLTEITENLIKSIRK